MRNSLPHLGTAAITAQSPLATHRPGLRQLLLVLGWLFSLLHPCSSGAQSGNVVYTLTCDQATLTLRQLAAGQYGVGLQLGSSTTYYQQNTPLALEVINSSGTSSWIMTPYSSVQSLEGGLYRGSGTVTSASGSVFSFTDTYQVFDGSGSFRVDRSVTVTSANANDRGFSTRLAVQRPVASGMNDYDFFMPGVWYRDNADVPDYALVTDYSDYYYWIREDRLPLPLFMLRQKNNGATLSVAHYNPDGGTFAGEDGYDRIVDGRMQFGSLGMENNNQPLIGMLFPGTEGERSLINGGTNARRWAARSHPVTTNFTQNYQMLFRLTGTSDFVSAMSQTWQQYYNVFNPAVYSCDLTKIYLDGIGVLNRYWQTVNNAPGFPFEVKLYSGQTSGGNRYQMGFVGQQLPNAYILIREGFNANSTILRTKGEQIVDFWVNNTISRAGCPFTWYDADAQSTIFNDYNFTRVASEGLLGVLQAWNEEKKRGIEKPQWLKTCTQYGDWLADKQAGDGAFPRIYSATYGQTVNSSNTATSNSVKLLVDLYKVTGQERYRQAALKAGNFIFTTVYQNFRYIGGAVDNPDVPDKEAISMALNAFLALYDLDKDGKWLDAAQQTAQYYQSWVYSWQVPIPAGGTNITMPRNRTNTGTSLIATGQFGCDSYASYDAFNFYRLYLYRGDPQMLKVAKQLLYNSKQGLDWDPNDPLGYADPGLQQEAQQLVPARGTGVGTWLPWQAYNMIDPMVKLWDVFGTYGINEIENQSSTERQNKHNAYSNTRGYVSGSVSEPSTNLVSGAIYRLIGKQSGKVMEVAANSNNIQLNTWNSTPKQQWVITGIGSGYFKILNASTGQAVDVEGFATANSANISQHPYNATSNQQWAIEKVDGYYRITNRNSSKVVDVVNFSTVDGANISQYQWTGTDNQLWTLELLSNPAAIVSGTTYQIVARHSGQCIDVENTSTVLSDGGNISQYPYYGGQNQKWTVTDVGGGYYKFINVNSGKAMDVEDFSTAQGANISQYTYNGTPNQQWQIADVGGGYYKIIARHSGQCVDVVNFSTANSANITQYPYFGTTNQQWQFIPVSAAAGGRIAAQQPEAQLLLSEAQLLLWPNPAREVFTIQYHSPIAQPARVLITDLLSRPLQQHQVQLQPGANQIELATEHLPAGLVTVQLVTQTEQKIKKLQLVK